MATYYPATPFPPQFVNPDTGDLLSGGTLEAYEAGTTTPVEFFSDDAGTIAGNALTLNAGGYPTVSGTVITPFLSSERSYKFVLKDAANASKWVVDNIVNYFWGFPSNSSVVLVFDTIEDLKDGRTADGRMISVIALAAAGARVRTKRYRSGSDAGGANYKITSLAEERSRRGSSSWTPDGYGDHYIGGGATYVAVLLEEEFHNVLHYGARGNGVADDTPAIQAAINSASAEGGGTVFLDKGTYKVGSVALQSKVNITGAGESAILSTTLSTIGALLVNGKDSIEIYGFKIQGNNLQNGPNPQMGDVGVYIANSTNVTVRNMTITGMWAWGAVSVGPACENINYHHNRVTNIGNQSGLSFSGGTKNSSASHNFIKDIKLYGLEVESSSGAAPAYNDTINLSNNYVENAIAGLGIAFSSKNITGTGNVFKDCNNVNLLGGATGYGAYIVGDTTSASRMPSDIHFTNTVIQDCSNYCVLMSGKMERVSFEGLTIRKGTDISKIGRVIGAVNGDKKDIRLINVEVDCSGAATAVFKLDSTDGLEVRGAKVRNLSTTTANILSMGGTTINAVIEQPIVPASEISLLTATEDVRLGTLSNTYINKDFPEYTILSGSSANRYITFKRPTRIIGVRWCINPSNVGGGGSDYWILRLDGVTTGSPFFATVPNRDNWAATSLNIFKNAGDVLDCEVVSALGVTFSHKRFQLLVI